MKAVLDTNEYETGVKVTAESSKKSASAGTNSSSLELHDITSPDASSCWPIVHIIY